MSKLEISATNSSLDEASSKRTSIKKAEDLMSCTAPPNATEGGKPNPAKETEPVPSEAKEIDGSSNALLDVSVTVAPKDETLKPPAVDDRTPVPLMIDEDLSMSKAEKAAPKADCALNNIRKTTRYDFNALDKSEIIKAQSPTLCTYSVRY